MRKSKDKEVQRFLEKLREVGGEKLNVVESARETVFATYPKVSERIIYGGIMFSLEKDFGGIFVSKNHVSFEFSDGYKFTDSDSLLEGTGKFRRHLKLKSLSDIEDKRVSDFVKQVSKVM